MHVQLSGYEYMSVLSQVNYLTTYAKMLKLHLYMGYFFTVS